MGFKTPCLASNIVDELGVGSVLQHLHKDGVRAVIIDWVGSSPDCVAVVAYENEFSREKFNKKLYKVQMIDLDQFIALTTGGDELLIC